MSWYISNNKKTFFKADSIWDKDVTEAYIIGRRNALIIEKTDLCLIRFEKSVKIINLYLYKNLITSIEIPKGISYINLLDNPLNNIFIENPKTKIHLNSFNVMKTIIGKAIIALRN